MDSYRGKRVAAYIRVSSKEQAMHGESIDDQTQYLRKWAEDKGVAIVREFVDAGFSARKSWKTRPAMQELLATVQSGKIDMIIFTKLDRWFRNIRDYQTVQAVLEEHHVSWQATLEDYETITSAGRFKVNLMLSIAEHEADQTSERIRFTQAQKRERGEVITGNPPIGYTIKDKRLDIDPETEPAVRNMFEVYMKTGSVNAVVDAFAEIGIEMRCHRLKRLLSNPAYRGDWFGTPCPAYLNTAQWERVQALHKRRPKATEHKYYFFSGLVQCAECGGRKSGALGGGGSHKKYYRCNIAYDRGKCTDRTYMKEERIERFLLDNVERLMHSAELEYMRQQKKPKKEVDLPKLRKRRDKLKDLYLDDLITKEAYAEEYRQLTKEIDAATAEQEASRASTSVAKGVLVAGWKDLYQELDDEHKSAFWHSILDSVTVDKDGNISVSFSGVY